MCPLFLLFSMPVFARANSNDAFFSDIEAIQDKVNKKVDEENSYIYLLCDKFAQKLVEEKGLETVIDMKEKEINETLYAYISLHLNEKTLNEIVDDLDLNEQRRALFARGSSRNHAMHAVIGGLRITTTFILGYITGKKKSRTIIDGSNSQTLAVPALCIPFWFVCTLTYVSLITKMRQTIKLTPPEQNKLSSSCDETEAIAELKGLHKYHKQDHRIVNMTISRDDSECPRSWALSEKRNKNKYKNKDVEYKNVEDLDSINGKDIDTIDIRGG